MFPRWPVAFLLGAVSCLVHSAVPAAPQFLSGNGQYSVELSRTPENLILISVFKVSKEGKTFDWSRPVDWEEVVPGWTGGPIVQEIKPLVSNDGNTVVLRDENTPEQKNEIKIFGRKEGQDHRVRVFDRRELTSVRPLEDFPPEERYIRGMRKGTSYALLGALLDFIIDDEKSYAIWFGQTDRWALISLETFKARVVDDSTEIARLNQIAYRLAQNVVAQHQPTPVRRMFTVLQQKVAKIAPSLAPPFASRNMSLNTAAAYLFLTTRRNASDRTYIQNLVQFPVEGIQMGHPFKYGELEIGCVAGMERLIGDYLLSRWNGETNRESLARDAYLMLPQDSSRFLGTIHVNFQLPIQLPPTNSGILWAYAIPNHVPTNQWDTSDAVISFRTYFHLFQEGETLGPLGGLHFRLLAPGEYRIKMIWERNPPGNIWRTNAYTALPGDYESVQTSPISVKSGELVHISLACTNRIGDGTAYRQDDTHDQEKTKAEGGN